VAIVHLGEKRVIRSATTEIPAEKGKQILIRIEEVHAESDPTHGTILRIPTWRVKDLDLPGPGEAPGSGAAGVPGGKDDRKAARGDITSTHTGAADAGMLPDGGAPSIPAGGPGASGMTSSFVTAGQTIVFQTAGKPAAAFGKSGGVIDLAAPAAREDLLVTVPTHDFQNLFTAYRRRTLLLFLGIFVVGTALSAGLASRFTRPVRRLDAGIRRLAEGDLEVQVPATGQDEIGRLARAFNEMARRLRAGRERERDLRRREKLSALGRMAAGVAHDVRNPLHSINLTLQNLEETARPGEADRVREFDRSVGIIRDEIRRLDRLVENFLRFARSDRTARVPVDVARLARETAQLVEKEAERRRVRVEVIAGEEPGVVEGNMESLRSSVLNLVLNSFEAMPEGGTLTLTVSHAGGEARLEVADTGRGIPAEEQEKVFEFAYTSREEGHGMGLAMVHQVVVEEHGGRVALESRPGEGTRVLLAFPTSGASPQPSEAPAEERS
jgi:signal transduction histidine kinase